MSDDATGSVRNAMVACMALCGIDVHKAANAADFMLGDDCRLIRQRHDR